MTTTTIDHIEQAADALRAHLHERPWTDEPHRIYSALADMQDIARRLSDVAYRAGETVQRATGSDDGSVERHADQAEAAAGHAAQLLHEAAQLLGEAQGAASHLIWGD